MRVVPKLTLDQKMGEREKRVFVVPFSVDEKILVSDHRYSACVATHNITSLVHTFLQ